MKKDKLAHLLFLTISIPTLAFGVFVLIAISFAYSENHPNPYDVECKTKNGVPVFASGTRYCLKPDIFVMKPEGF